MNIVCEVCGDIGCKELLLCCRGCKDAAAHLYCLDNVIFNGSLVDWLCYECQQKSEGAIQMVMTMASERDGNGSGSNRVEENPIGGSLEKVSSERASHAYSGSTLEQPTTKGADMTCQQKKHIKKKSNVGPMGNSTNREGRNTIAKGLRSCDTIGTETIENHNREKPLVDNENSVHSLKFEHPTPLIVNCLGYRLGDKAIVGSHRNSKRTPKSLRAQFRGSVQNKKKNVLRSKSKQYSPASVHGNSVLENDGANISNKDTDRDNQVYQPASVGCKNTEVKSGNDSKKLVGALEDKSEGHNDSDINVIYGLTRERKKEAVRFQLDYQATDELQQRSIVANATQQSTPQYDAMDKVMPCSPNMRKLAKENIENQNMPFEHIENQSRKEYQSEPSNPFYGAHSNPSSETYPLKFLPECSTTEVEISVDFGKDNTKRRRQLILNDDDDDDDDEEEEDLSNTNPSNGGPVKKRRRYIDANEEDEEASTGNDDANMESQIAVAEDYRLQSRISPNSDTADHQQYYIYSRPCDEPVWSGTFMINSEVFGEFDAHLSNKACQKVWYLSRKLQPVIEVMKLPRLQACPKSWKSGSPTDNCIGLFFFPCSSRPNEESNKLVNEITESDDALKVTIGFIELLIFSSTVLPEQNQLFQGKYYLWGLFKHRKDVSGRGGLVGDGIACATEESKLPEQRLMYQLEGMQSKSTGQETSAVMHADSEIVVEGNCVAQELAMKIANREGITLPDSKLLYGKLNSPRDGSKCSVHPRIDRESPEEMNQHEEYLSSAVLNGSSAAKSNTECGQGESHTGSGPPTKELFGSITARTLRAQQLIEEMISDGSVVFSVPEQTETTESCSNAGVGSGLNSDTDYQHPREHPQSFDFILTGPDVPDVASGACLELFPFRQEKIGWASRVESTEEVDLDLSLGSRSRAPTVQL